MKILLFLLALAPVILNSQAQLLDLSQSSPAINWKTISNDYVKVIYPDYLGEDSIYIANLVEHYGTVVGKTYGIDRPQQFTLLIRPEVASPNGFVTVGPQRSEWFSSSTFSPFVGTSEWYQTLSIHEYRHLQQYDHATTGTVKFFNLAFGDFGRSLAFFFGLRPWYFEGDAVWAETKYTDSGRGRSSRFLARLKALVLSDRIPTYNEFINGTYNNSLPNHYLYGYVLVSYATQKFGEDIWAKITKSVADLPHPLRLYSSFEDVTKMPFRDFYNEAMTDLKSKWEKDTPSDNKLADYREEASPYRVDKDIYYLKYDLDSYWSVYKKSKAGEEKIIEIPYVKSLMQFHISNKIAVYNQFLPDFRYAYKGSSDLVIIDLEKGSQKKITSEMRLFNPKLNHSASKIIAVNFKNDLAWELTELDLNGNILNSFPLQGYKPVEMYYANENQIVAILSSKTGTKSMNLIDLKNKKIIKKIIPDSRNNIASLFVDNDENIFFEAQYKGSNEIFKINSKNQLFKCSDSPIGSFNPSVYGDTLYFSSMDVNGSKISQNDVNDCRVIKSSEIVDYNYLDESPSDNYNKFPIVLFSDHEKMYSKNKENYQSESYDDFDSRVLIPHSWSFIGDRGYQISVTTDNYLGTIGVNAAIGDDAEEKEAFASFNLDYKKYYPIINFHGDKRRRKVDFFESDTTLSWSEKSAGLSISLPYLHKKNLYNFESVLTLNGDYLDVSRFKVEGFPSTAKNRYFLVTGAQLSFSWDKDLKYRSLMSPLSLSGYGLYENAKNNSRPSLSSYRSLYHLKLTLPGLYKNNAFFATYTQESRRASQAAYKFVPRIMAGDRYVFSRGYEYESVPEYEKISANYVLPLLYPDLEFGNWYYLKRVNATLFYDSTLVQGLQSQSTLSSYGGELELQSRFFQILPVGIGGSYAFKNKGKKTEFDFFINLGFQY